VEICSDKWLGVAASPHRKPIRLPFEDLFCSGGFPTAGPRRGDTVATKKALDGEDTVATNMSPFGTTSARANVDTRWYFQRATEESRRAEP
jgi:hypothetical protein